MSKVQILIGMPPRRTEAAWRHLAQLGHDVDPQTGAVNEHPDVTRVRRENLERLRNPPPTLAPQTQHRIRDDLAAGRYHTPGGPDNAA